MQYNPDRNSQQRRRLMLTLPALLIALSLVLTNTSLLFAQNDPASYAARAFLPVINQASTSTEQVSAAVAPEAVCGTATVDGNASEWNLTADFFAPLYQAAKSSKAVLAKVYLRYDGATSTLYTLVLAEPGIAINANDPSGQFVKFGNKKKVDAAFGDDNVAPDFAYIGRNGATAQGWEASSIWPAGSYVDLNIHAQIIDQNGQSQTSAVVNRAIPLILSCPVGNGSIGDRVWNDTNRDGIQNNSEAGVPNVTVQLKDCNGFVLQTTTTNDQGYYHFNNLIADCYIVQVVLPTGFQFSSQDEGSDDNTDSDIDPLTGMSTMINLASGQNIDNVDAGINALSATLGDRVWHDANRNGIQDDGEIGVSDVTVTLLSGCSGNSVVDTTTTDGNGAYNFSGLAAGQYRVQISLPTGFQFSSQNQGSNEAADSDVNQTTGISDCITLSAGQDDPRWDAGINQVEAQLGSIGDFVWQDLNEDGQQDSNEPGIPNVTVKLLDANGNVLQTTTTNDDGAYQFTNLPSGVYSVLFVLPTGYSFTWASAGDDATDSDADSTTGQTAPFTLAAGEVNNTVDGGLIAGVYIKANGFGDTVFLDENGDGLQNIDEPGLQGVTVELISAQGNVLNTQTTGPGGYYAFLDLVVGLQYGVRVTLPAGYSFTTANVGSNDTIDSDVDPQTGQLTGIVIGAGTMDPHVDAGLRSTPN